MSFAKRSSNRGRRKRARRKQVTFGHSVVIEPSIDVLEKELNKVGRSIKDLRPLWKKESLRKVIADHLVHNLDTGAAAEGKKWRSIGAKAKKAWAGSAPESKSYRKRKRRQGYGDKALVRTGELRQEVGSTRARSMTKKQLKMGVPTKMGNRVLDLQAGKFFWFMDWTPKMRRDVNRIFGEYINGLLEAAAININASTTKTIKAGGRR